MSLTPLRFVRRYRDNSCCYGYNAYKTDCGRFHLVRDEQQWIIQTAWIQDSPSITDQWDKWLVGCGLESEPFPTRASALDALASALNGDGLMDATIISSP